MLTGTLQKVPRVPQDDTDLIRSMEALIEHLDRIAETAARLAAEEQQDRPAPARSTPLLPM
jgi:hypothetical protein